MIKIIALSVTMTISACALVVYLFMTPILGLFSLTTTTVANLHKLEASNAILSRLRDRNKLAKEQLKKKYLAKLGKKLSSSTIAAATIGTAAVAASTVYFAASEYCERQEELLALENELESKNDTFDQEKCLDLAKDDAAELLATVRAPNLADLVEIKEEVISFSSDNWNLLQEKYGRLGSWFKSRWSSMFK
jgi:hypothetical protein